MSSFECHKCGVKSVLPTAFDSGAVLSITCPNCGHASAVRSPVPITEKEMVDMLSGEDGPGLPALAIETEPPHDGVASSLSSLPSLQLTEFYISDATGTPVHLDWLGKLFGAPGLSERPAAGVVTCETNLSSPSDAAATKENLLVHLESGEGGGEGKRKRPAAVKEPKPKAPRARKPAGEKRQKTEKGNVAGKGGEADGAPKEDEDEGEGEDEEEDDEDETYNWACCDRCQKWRRLPDGPEFEADALPEQWFCYMNPNSKRNSCDKPEERMGKGEIWDEDEGEEEDEEEGEGEDDDPDRGTCVARQRVRACRLAAHTLARACVPTA